MSVSRFSNVKPYFIPPHFPFLVHSFVCSSGLSSSLCSQFCSLFGIFVKILCTPEYCFKISPGLNSKYSNYVKHLTPLFIFLCHVPLNQYETFAQNVVLSGGLHKVVGSYGIQCLKLFYLLGKRSGRH